MEGWGKILRIDQWSLREVNDMRAIKKVYSVIFMLIIVGGLCCSQSVDAEDSSYSGLVDKGWSVFSGYECARIYVSDDVAGGALFDSSDELRRKGHFIREFPSDKAKILYFIQDDMIGIKTGSKIINGYIEAVGYNGGGSDTIRTGWLKERLVHRYHDSYNIKNYHNEDTGCFVEFRVDRKTGSKYVDFKIYNLGKKE